MALTTARAQPQRLAPLAPLSGIGSNLAPSLGPLGPIRLVIADATARARTALRHAVNVAGIAIVADAATTDEVRAAVFREHPDVVLIAMALSYAAVIALVREISQRQPSTAVVVIGSSEDENELIDALRAGASGYVHRDVSSSALVREIAETAGGDVVLSRADARLLVSRLNDGPPAHVSARALSLLSAREMEVMRFLSQGQTAREIAAVLGISKRTVEGHVARICEKLGARNRADAVRRYIEAR
jgi:DNA-binding NarL/FixJ family response regulator